MRNRILSLGQAEANNPRVNPQDGTFVMGGRQYIGKDFYVYSAGVDNLAASGSGSDQITIQADADFVLQKMSFTAFAATPVALTNSSRIIPAATVQMIDTASGRELFDEPQDIPGLFGTGELPFIMPTPRLFPARSTVRFDFANLDASTAVRLRLLLIGFKAYTVGS